MIYKKIAKLLNCYIAKSKKNNSTIQQYNNLKPQGGFTLIELMVVLSVTAVLGTLGIAGFVTYNQIQAVQSAANDLVTVLNIAKSRSQSQVKPSGVACSTNSSGVIRVLKGHIVTVYQGGAAATKNKYKVEAICSLAADLDVCDYDRTVSVIALKSLPSKIEFKSPTNPKVYCFPTLIGGVRDGNGDELTEAGEITLSGYGREKTIEIDSAGGIRIQ